MRFLLASLYVKIKNKTYFGHSVPLKTTIPGMICSLMPCVSSTEATTKPKPTFEGILSVYRLLRTNVAQRYITVDNVFTSKFCFGSFGSVSCCLLLYLV